MLAFFKNIATRIPPCPNCFMGTQILDPSGRTITSSKALWPVAYDPRDLRGMLDAAIKLRDLGCSNGVIQAYRDAVALDPEYALAWHGLGSIYLDIERVDEAIEAFNMAVRLNPRFDEAHYSLALAKASKGNFINAVEALKNIPPSSPLYIKACYLKGMCYHKLDRLPEAIAAYRVITKLDFRNVEAYSMIGLCNREIGNFKEAADGYLKALQFDPDNEEILYNLGYCWIKLNRNRDAIETLSRISPNSNIFLNARYYIGHLYTKSGNDLEALTVYYGLLKIGFDSARIHFEIGMCHYRLLNLAAAKDAFDEVFARDPELSLSAPTIPDSFNGPTALA